MEEKEFYDEKDLMAEIDKIKAATEKLEKLADLKDKIDELKK